MGIDLKGLRKDKGLTQKEFSEIINIGQSYLSELENGRRDISNEVFDKLVNAFGEELINEYSIKKDKDFNLPKANYTSGVPYYNVDFIGGFDLVLNDQTINPEYLIDFQQYNNADYWCNVTGRSMEPEISHGDIIAIKEVVNWQTFLPFGEIYALVTTEHRTIKKVTAASRDDFFLLVPLNPSIEFKPQEIPKSVILRVFKVLGCMKRF